MFPFDIGQGRSVAAPGGPNSAYGPASFHPSGGLATIADIVSTVFQRRENARRPRPGLRLRSRPGCLVFPDYGFWAHQGHGWLPDAGGDSLVLPRRLVPLRHRIWQSPTRRQPSSRARFAVCSSERRPKPCPFRRRIANWNGQVQSGPGDRCSSARLQGLVAPIFPEFPDNSQVGTPIGRRPDIRRASGRRERVVLGRVGRALS